MRDLTRVVERLGRIRTDDRFLANRRELADGIEGWVTDAINELTDLRDDLRGGTS